MAAVAQFFALLRDAGVGRQSIDKCRTVLCSIFNTAVNDRVIAIHPCAGVPAPTVVEGPLRVLTPGEYATIIQNLRDEPARLFVELALESGCRWGEMAELRLRDLDPVDCTLTVSRTVVELRPRYTPHGEDGFVVKGYPKNQCWRKLAISRTLMNRLTAEAEMHYAAPGSLLFPAPCPTPFANPPDTNRSRGPGAPPLQPPQNAARVRPRSNHGQTIKPRRSFPISGALICNFTSGRYWD
jgi:integrase